MTPIFSCPTSNYKQCFVQTGFEEEEDNIQKTPKMAAEKSMPVACPLRLVHDVVEISVGGFSGFFKKDCTDLARRVSLLGYLLEEIRDFEAIRGNAEVGFSPFSRSCFSELIVSLQAAKRIIFAAKDINGVSSDGLTKKITFQFQCVTLKLEKALASLPYNDFEISEEVQEQVELVRSQLKRAIERYGGPLNSTILHRALSQPLDKEINPIQPNNTDYHDVTLKADALSDVDGANSKVDFSKEFVGEKIDDSSCKNVEENKKSDSVALPDDFLCPISLELMRDPVTVSTGQTYERSYIQRWIDCGNSTCPKTQQKLHHLTLTPNYVLRSLISQWCIKHNVEQPALLINGRIKRSDGSFRDVTGDMEAIEVLVRKLSSRSIEDQRAAVSETRSLSKRSTDNRILLAQAGAIPILVSLLSSHDTQIQDNAVTSVLNLSIYDNNKGLIMLANAIPSIVQVLRSASTEAKENAAATLFSLSVADENKIIIGASGAIPALVDLLENGRPRGKKDAATALFNLCIYQGNKGRAVRAGIISALLKMLTDASMVDEALTILSVLASHQEAKLVIVKASMIPLLIDLLRTGLPRNKENAAAILLSLCKRDNENLGVLSRLGAVIPLSELVKNGTERSKRKAVSLLEYLRKSQQV